MTPHDVISAADRVLVAVGQGRWPDCPRRVDDVHLALFGVSCMGAAREAYRDPRSALRYLGSATYPEKFIEVVSAASLRPSCPRPGAVGCLPQQTAFLGWTVAICARPELWVHPTPRGYEFVAGVSECWHLEDL